MLSALCSAALRVHAPPAVVEHPHPVCTASSGAKCEQGLPLYSLGAVHPEWLQLDGLGHAKHTFVLYSAVLVNAATPACLVPIRHVRQSPGCRMFTGLVDSLQGLWQGPVLWGLHGHQCLWLGVHTTQLELTDWHSVSKVLH